MSDSGSPSIARVGDRRRQVLGRVFAPRRGQRVEVLEHVEQRGHLLLFRGTALEFGIVVAEQLLGVLQHPREVDSGRPSSDMIT